MRSSRSGCKDPRGETTMSSDTISIDTWFCATSTDKGILYIVHFTCEGVVSCVQIY